MNKKKVIILTIFLLTIFLSFFVITKPNLRKLLGSVNLMNLQPEDVPYTNNSQSNIKDAIDDLYTKVSEMECASGYTKGATTANGGYICEIPMPICKRATTLHTETCQQSSNYCAADVGNGNEITYGVLGTGSTLQAGEALDCKVTTTGDFTERFYYMTDLEGNSDYAVLLYYKDTSNGPIAYDSNGTNYNGPRTALTSLPTISSWDNISLAEPVRQLYSWDGSNTYTTTNNGSKELGTFDYSGYAGRLLTAAELKAACPTVSINNGSLSNCKYIMENTKYSKESNATYGPWIETPQTSDSSYVWRVNSYYRYLTYINANNSSSYGARPVIEVLKSKIELE